VDIATARVVVDVAVNTLYLALVLILSAVTIRKLLPRHITN